MKALCAAGLAALAVSSTARATVEFVATDVPTTTTDFGYLNSSLNPLLAVDLDGSGETINGVGFSNGGMTGGSGGIAYSVSSSPDSENHYENFNAGASDPNVASLLSNFFYPGSHQVNGTGPYFTSPETLTVSGLTPGQTYTLTLLSSSFGAKQSGGRAETITGLDGVTTDYQQNNGAFSTLAYTAAANAQGQIGFTSAADDLTDGLHLYGFTLVSVPEPATFGFIGLAAMTALARKRRA